jgi:hypothetical protein
VKRPFLMDFRSELPDDASDPMMASRYNPIAQCNECPDGEPIWSMARRRATSCYTSGRYRKGYRNKRGKWVPSKYLKSRTDRRAGR